MTAPSRAVARSDPKVGLLKSRLERMTDSLVTILGTAESASRQKLLTLLYFQQRPALAGCDVESIAESVLQVAEWGLELGTEAHIVPQGGRAQARKDYKGEIKLAIRNKRITSCRMKVIGASDHFEVEEGLRPTIVHQPDWRKPGAPIGAYAIVTLPDGSSDFEVMNHDQIESVRKRSPASAKGPWITDWPEMAKKTVCRRLLKRHLGDVSDEDDVGPDAEAPRAPTPLKQVDHFGAAAALPAGNPVESEILGAEIEEGTDARD